MALTFEVRSLLRGIKPELHTSMRLDREHIRFSSFRMRRRPLVRTTQAGHTQLVFG